MTLILTVANSSGIYQSSDYRLTDRITGAPISDDAGSKQLQASFDELDLRLAFTGIADFQEGSERKRMVDCLAAEINTLPHKSGLQEICEALVRRILPITKPLRLRGVLEIVLTAGRVGQPFQVAVISNVDWRKRPPEARSEFDIRIHTIKKPFDLISGYRGAVPILEKHRLRALVRGAAKTPQHILDALSEINKAAAKRGGGYISDDCWATAQTSDGETLRSASQNFGKRAGDIPLLNFGSDLRDALKENFRSELLGTLIATASARTGPGGGTPVPAPTGEPRVFTLSGSMASAELRSPDDVDCAVVEISQTEWSVKIRLNEEATVPFAKVALKASRPISKAFPRPLHPWPQLAPPLSIDDSPNPRGWRYSVGYWVQENVHRVTILPSSGSIRNVGFLGPDDEIVIVAPSEEMEFSWSEHEEAPSAEIQARIWWRSRLDGTNG